MEVQRSMYCSAIGPLLLEADVMGITAIRPVAAMESYVCGNSKFLEQTKKWLDVYFSGENPDFQPACHLVGTDFQRQVWNLLRQIPFGEVITYGQLADAFPCNMSAQAVGHAVGKNPIAILIPCHRVVGANGSLGGYAYGMEIKAHLLRLEKSTK